MKTRVVNLRKEPYDVYIGRANRGVGAGSDGSFANPFWNGNESEREYILWKYEQWFLEEVEKNQDFREKVERLRGKVLGCFCKPKRCHGDILAAWLDGELKKGAP